MNIEGRDYVAPLFWDPHHFKNHCRILCVILAYLMEQAGRSTRTHAFPYAFPLALEWSLKKAWFACEIEMRSIENTSLAFCEVRGHVC